MGVRWRWDTADSPAGFPPTLAILRMSTARETAPRALRGTDGSLDRTGSVEFGPRAS